MRFQGACRETVLVWTKCSSHSSLPRPPRLGRSQDATPGFLRVPATLSGKVGTNSELVLQSGESQYFRHPDSIRLAPSRPHTSLCSVEDEEHDLEYIFIPWSMFSKYADNFSSIVVISGLNGHEHSYMEVRDDFSKGFLTARLFTYG